MQIKTINYKKMDILYALHVAISIALLSIPFWPHRYLQYGVYIPLGISLLWILCNGCPLTHAQSGLDDQTFTRHFLQSLTQCPLTETDVSQILTFMYLLITVVGFHRLRVVN